MATMTDSEQAGNGEAGSARPEEEPDPSAPAEDPGYLVQTGEVTAEDGSVVPIIGGLPAVEGSAWDIGASVDDRGANLADEEQESRRDQSDHKDTSGGSLA
jgi:hypothetical protein